LIQPENLLTGGKLAYLVLFNRRPGFDQRSGTGLPVDAIAQILRFLKRLRLFGKFT